MLTDNLSLLDFITKAKINTQLRLLIDVKVVKDAFQRHQLGSIRIIRSEHNSANAPDQSQKE